MPVNEATLINAGVQAGLLNNEQLAPLRLKARQERASLVEVATRTFRFPEVALYRALAELRGVPFVAAQDLVVDPEALRRLPSGLMQRRLFLPIRGSEGEPVIVLSDPDDHVALDSAKRTIGKEVKRALAYPKALEAVISRSIRDLQSGADEDDVDGDQDSILLLDQILREAYVYRASDIHFEPTKHGMRIRLRVDGRLQEYRRDLSVTARDGVVSRIKVLSELDITEQRLNQDGGFSYAIGGPREDEADIRVATVPARWGERVTLRILGQETGTFDLAELGMPPQILAEFRGVIGRPHGIVLVTGPTGSGKSTTLYAALSELDSDEFNILSVEDPVEQIVEGVTQVQVSQKLGFAKALRSFLRHDPDVLLVGEIRDQETADAALKAAITGHLVLSTLHTNDAAGAVTRLVDIGCERFLIGASLLGVIAQRLVRRLCPLCREQGEPSPEEVRRLALETSGQTVWRAKGCPACLGTGYQGRIGVFEGLWCDDRLSIRISEGASEDEIRESALRRRSLSEDAREKVLTGQTSLDEVLRLNVGL